MDPVSQGAFGVALSLSYAKRKYFKYALIIGIIAGMAPDLDILISSDDDSLLALDFHRHFTHSLFFVPVGAFLVACFFWLLFFRKKLKFRYIYLFSFLGYLTHGILDSFTSYGTILFWPISDYRVTLGYISIIDPLFTIPLIFAIILSYIKKSKLIMKLGLIIALSYIAIGSVNYYRVKNYIFNIATERGHKIERYFLNPTIFNNFAFRTIYQFEGNYYVDAIRLKLFSESIFKEGDMVAVINEDNLFPDIPADSTLKQDIKRFSYFSKGFIYFPKDDKNIIADLRYGVLPYQINALWGIRIDKENANKHAKFVSLTDKIGERDYDEFYSFLFPNKKSN